MDFLTSGGIKLINLIAKYLEQSDIEKWGFIKIKTFHSNVLF